MACGLFWSYPLGWRCLCWTTCFENGFTNGLAKGLQESDLRSGLFGMIPLPFIVMLLSLMTFRAYYIEIGSVFFSMCTVNAINQLIFLLSLVLRLPLLLLSGKLLPWIWNFLCPLMLQEKFTWDKLVSSLFASLFSSISISTKKEEWMQNGTLYTRLNGSNDDCYIAK